MVAQLYLVQGSCGATVNGNTNTNPAKITMSYGSNNTIIWNNIAYYAPNGQPYQYLVEEKGINGYKVYTDTGYTNKVSENKSGSGIYEATVTGTYDSVNKQGSALLHLQINMVKYWGR